MKLTKYLNNILIKKKKTHSQYKKRKSLAFCYDLRQQGYVRCCSYVVHVSRCNMEMLQDVHLSSFLTCKLQWKYSLCDFFQTIYISIQLEKLDFHCVWRVAYSTPSNLTNWFTVFVKSAHVILRVKAEIIVSTPVLARLGKLLMCIVSMMSLCLAESIPMEFFGRDPSV